MNKPLFAGLGPAASAGVAPTPLLNLPRAPQDGKFETVTGSILATIGAGLVGWYLGSKIADDGSDASPALLVGGGALLVAGITFSSIGGKKKRRSLSELDERRQRGTVDLARLGRFSLELHQDLLSSVPCTCEEEIGAR